MKAVGLEVWDMEASLNARDDVVPIAGGLIGTEQGALAWSGLVWFG